MEPINYLEQISNVPPPEVAEHAKKLFKKEYIVYKSEYALNPLTGLKERMAKLRCTSCGEIYYETYLPAGCNMARGTFIDSRTNETLGSGKHMLCPCCGAEVEVHHSSDIGQNRVMEQVFPINLQKLADGKVALLQWVAERRVNNNGDVSVCVLPCEGFVFEKKKAIRLNGQACNYSYRYFKGTWSQLKKCTDSFGSSRFKNFVNLDKHTLDGTVLENAKLYEYCKATAECFPVTYLRIYQKYPNIENLVMQGASCLVNEHMCRSCTGYYGPLVSYQRLEGIDLKQKQPFKMLGLNKVEFKEAVGQKWSKQDLEFYKKYRNYGIKPEDMWHISKHSYYYLEKCLAFETNIMKLIQYTEKQKKRYPKNSSIIAPSYIYDYWDMVIKNGGSLADSQVKYPKAIVKAHDEEAKKLKALKNEKFKAAFTELAKKYREFTFSAEGLIIRIAEHPDELTYEGKELRHCVGRYIEIHSEGYHCIFFIRKKESPDKPYYTLELDMRTYEVLQNRGKGNCSQTEEVEEFVTQWLGYIKQLSKENKKNGKRNYKLTA